MAVTAVPGAAEARAGRGERARDAAWTAAAVAAAALVVFWSCIQPPNVDSWFMLPTGAWIVEHGIPETNPFAPEGADYPITVQQWAYCVILHLFHSAGGWPAVGAMNGMFCCVMLASLAFALRSLGLARPAAARVAVPFLLTAFFDAIIRPHNLDMAMWLYVIGAMERARRGGSCGWAWSVPVLAALHANLHLSMVPIDAAVAAVYALPVLRRGDDGRWRPAWSGALPLSVAGAVVLAGTLTPHGIAGLLIPFWGSVGATYGGFIVECQPLWSGAGTLAWAMVAALCSVVAIGQRVAYHGDEVDLASLALSCAAFAATCLRARFYTLLCVSWIPLMAPAAGGTASARRHSSHGYVASAMLIVIAMSTVGPVLLELAELNETRLPREHELSSCVEAIESLGAQPGDAVITTNSTGGYLEHRGYRVTMDSCTERWSQPMPDGRLSPDLFDFFDSVNRRDGSAERYVTRWDGRVEWAVVGVDALTITREFNDSSYPVEGTVVGYLESSPDWERVHGEWERGEGHLSPCYVYRKVP